jgi:hypothetical protein
MYQVVYFSMGVICPKKLMTSAFLVECLNAMSSRTGARRIKTTGKQASLECQLHRVHIQKISGIPYEKLLSTLDTQQQSISSGLISSGCIEIRFWMTVFLVCHYIKLHSVMHPRATYWLGFTRDGLSWLLEKYLSRPAQGSWMIFRETPGTSES